MTLKPARLTPLLALAALLLAAAPAALAQSGSMSTSLGANFEPEFSARDLKVMVRVLDLKPDEQQALQALYDGYAGKLKSEGNLVKESAVEDLERAEAMNDATLLGGAREKYAAFDKRAEEWRKQFLEDLKSLLNRDQEARWPILERELRRIKSIGGGKITGENLDIVRITEDALGDTPMPPTVNDILGRYREEIDHALTERQRFIDNEGKGFSELLKSDAAKAHALWKESMRIRATVRDVNERFARQVAAELPDPVRAGFEKKVFDQAFPMLVKPSKVDEYLRDALDLSTLTKEQRTELAAVKARHESKRMEWARQAAIGWRDFELTNKPGELSKALGEPQEESHQRFNGAWLDENHPLVKARRERFVLDSATRRTIDGVLTSEQREAVPSRVGEIARFDNWESWGL
jgi:Spy/CpxP family protein refolding chaperone